MRKPWLYLPAKWAHELSSWALPLYAFTFGTDHPPVVNPLNWKNLHFPNRLGTAGGLDKDGESSFHWKHLGPGFLEIGTVTPLPQKPNEGKVIDRDYGSKSLWNKMGFPSIGAKELRSTLTALKPQLTVPLFVNIGKNRNTPNESAALDYQSCAETLDSVADVFVINISSPNTKGLRDLQGQKEIENLIQSVRKVTQRPLLIKLSPDMSPEGLKACLDAGMATEIGGFVLTNTTLHREAAWPFPSEGGVSGRPLTEKSEAILKTTIEYLGARRKDFLLVSVGGIFDSDDVESRLKLGADLVQIYTGLVYHGPGLYLDILTAFRGAQGRHSKTNGRLKSGQKN